MLSFDVFGLDRDVFTMLDRETDSLWTHLGGTAIAGSLAGSRLTFLSMGQMTWGAWKEAYPDTLVLSADTPFSSNYTPVQIAVYNDNEALYGDKRLASNALVVGVEVNGVFKGYPIDQLQQAGGVANDNLGGLPIVVIYDSSTRTGIAYARSVGGSVLEFSPSASGSGRIVDGKGTSWDLQGKAIAGPRVGDSLTFVPSFLSEWYGWSAYHPDTTIFSASQ
jgi:hypothetical protein